jgi:HK97 family phage major capsid protein
MKATGDTGELGVVDHTFGGWLVPIDFRANLMQKALEDSVIASRATPVPISGNKAQIPYVAESSRASSTHGGIIGYWPDEAVSPTLSNPKFGALELTLHKLAFLVYASDELLSDSAISFLTLLPQMFGASAAWELDNVFMEGTGAGQPLGMKNSPCLISVPKEGSQTADTVVYNNITKMYSRMVASSRSSAIWLINPDVWPQLLSLVDAGSNSLFVVNATQSHPVTIFGRPVFEHPACSTLGDAEDIMFVDPKQYLIAQKSGGLTPAVSTSTHVRFLQDQMAFKFIVRVDGQPWWSTALTPKNGSTTVSPIIGLAERA